MRTRDQIIDDAEKLLLDGIPKSEKQILEALTKLLTKFDTSGGKIQFNSDTTNLINEASKTIYEALNKAGYNSKVKKYLKDFDKIQQVAISEQKRINSITVADKRLNPIQRSAIQQTASFLAGNGIDASVIQPIKDILLKSATSGMTIPQAQIQLKNTVSAKFQPYVETYAKQSILSFDGMLQSRIQTDFDLDGYSYEGSIIQTSAGQCVKWANMGEIPISKIESELKWARENEGSTYEGYRISALIKGTNKDNFPINRGHFGCRHSVTAIRL